MANEKNTPPPPPTEAELAAAKDAEEAKKRAQEAADANAARQLAEDAAKSGGTGFVVAPGLSIVCRRGVVDAGQPVSELDFGRGKDDLAELVQRGAIVKA